MKEYKINYESINKVITNFQHDMVNAEDFFKLVKKYLEIFRKMLDLDLIMVLQPIVTGDIHVVELAVKNKRNSDYNDIKEYLRKYGFTKRTVLINKIIKMNEYSNEANIESPLVDLGKYRYTIEIPINNILRTDGGNGVLIFSNKNMEINKNNLFYDFIESIQETISLGVNRHRLEILLERENRFIKNSFNNINDAICVFDDKGVIHKINDAFSNLTGITNDKAIGYRIFEIFKLKNHNTLLDYLVKTENDIKQFEDNDVMYVKYEKKDGSTLILEKYLKNIIEKFQLLHMVILVDITKKVKKFEEIKLLGLYDSLTGVYNRNYYDDFIELIHIKNNYPISIIVGDINGLKLMNDIFGHTYGDKIIVDIANILKQHCKNGEVFRIGGDEFYIILENCDDSLAQDYINNVEKSCLFMFEKYNFVGISLGFHTMKNKNDTFDAAISQAESLMYYKKSIAQDNIKNQSLKKFKQMYNYKVIGGKQSTIRLLKLAKVFSKYIQLSKIETQDLLNTIEIHDIGKVAIDEQLLNKKEKYTKEEFKSMIKHCIVGYKIALLSYKTSHLARIILCHHEFYDGSGIPQGLKKSQIPYLSRIILVLVRYDNLKYGKHNEKAMANMEKVKKELFSESGKKLDPKIVKLFIQFLEKSKRIF